MCGTFDTTSRPPFQLGAPSVREVVRHASRVRSRGTSPWKWPARAVGPPRVCGRLPHPKRVCAIPTGHKGGVEETMLSAYAKGTLESTWQINRVLPPKVMACLSNGTAPPINQPGVLESWVNIAPKRLGSLRGSLKQWWHPVRLYLGNGDTMRGNEAESPVLTACP